MTGEKKMNTQQIRFLEEIAANGHVALNSTVYDGWVLRFSEGYTGRANSVSVLGPSTKDMAEKVAYCEERYAEQGLPALFKLTDYDAELQEYLAKKGYGIVTPTDVMILDLKSAETAGSTEDCVFTEKPSGWLPDYFAFEEQTDVHKQELFRRILAKVRADAVYCTVLRNGKPAACASGALEQGYMLLQNVVVDPELRGQGLGEKLCRAMILRAKEQGAEHVYLQVVQSNTAAMNLYRKLGFQKVYSYCYMKQPAVAYGEPGNIDSWMRLVRQVRQNFPGLETEESLEEHRQTVLKFMGKKQALCVKNNRDILGVLLFSRNRNMVCCLAVAPEYRRNRFASMLLEKALGEMDRTREITVSTFREDDEKGTAPRALYRAFGFREGELTMEFGYPNQVFILPAKV